MGSHAVAHLGGGPSPLSAEQMATWSEQGYLVFPRFASPELCEEMLNDTTDVVRAIAAGATASPAVIMPEANLQFGARDSEQFVSKVFRLHGSGRIQHFGLHPAVTGIVAALLGPDVDLFSSQFIYKHPGAWGQPLHQDSYYFPFVPEGPIVGVWLAISAATRVNGCLEVLPGSHHEPLHRHEAARRPNSNTGYREIVDYDGTAAVMEMDVGDLLVFDSLLMHRSSDNLSDRHRAALVLHYARAGTVDRSASPLYEWVPALRSDAAGRDGGRIDGDVPADR